jgi:hypothetical protein
MQWLLRFCFFASMQLLLVFMQLMLFSFMQLIRPIGLLSTTWSSAEAALFAASAATTCCVMFFY